MSTSTFPGHIFKKQIEEDILKKESKLIEMGQLNLQDRKQDFVRRRDSKKLAGEQLSKPKKFYKKLADVMY